MNEESLFPNVDNFFEKTMTAFHPDKAKFLIGIGILKVHQDLNGGTLDLTEDLLISIYAHMIKTAADHVGCTHDEIKEMLQGTIAALKTDMSERRSPSEEVSEISPGVSDYLKTLSAARH